MSQSPSIIKITYPVKELNGGGNLEIISDLTGEDSSAIVYTSDFQKFLTPNIIQSFKNPDITGGGSINSGTPFGFFEESISSQGGVLENYNQIYNFIIQLQLM
jgi:hypothetical protein